MVEGFPEMDDYDETILVADGTIYIEDCEDPEAVLKILNENGYDEAGNMIDILKKPVNDNYRPTYRKPNYRHAHRKYDYYEDNFDDEEDGLNDEKDRKHALTL